MPHRESLFYGFRGAAFEWLEKGTKSARLARKRAVCRFLLLMGEHNGSICVKPLGVETPSILLPPSARAVGL